MALSFHVILAACAFEMKFGMAARPGISIDIPSSPTGPLDEYEAFRQQHRPGQDPNDDHVSYATRASLFQSRSAEAEAHNARQGISYRKEVNRFSDHTDAELQGMLGYRRSGHLKEAGGSSFLQTRASPMVLATQVDWRDTLNFSRAYVHDQGACGSCWAAAAVGALEMHAELGDDGPGPLFGPTTQLSFEELVDCVENKHHCGGDGGCKGATSELAFEYVKEHGLAAVSGYHGYMSGGNGKCRGGRDANVKTARATSWERLPENRLQPLMEALVNHGPVVVSVDASGWSSYSHGIFDGCHRNAIVNHAVVAIGYGIETLDVSGNAAKRAYWLIRNSWGHTWGERGHIRVFRHASDHGTEGYCGIDKKPQEGVGCDGGPSEIPVCGMCGILSDSSFPIGVVVNPAIPVQQHVDVHIDMNSFAGHLNNVPVGLNRNMNRNVINHLNSPWNNNVVMVAAPAA